MTHEVHASIKAVQEPRQRAAAHGAAMNSGDLQLLACHKPQLPAGKPFRDLLAPPPRALMSLNLRQRHNLGDISAPSELMAR